MTASLTYPTGGEYREALFDTRRCFKDPLLAGGAPALDPLGMPKPISGAFGSVFTIRGLDGRTWAVKCFTRSVPDQALRYRRITEALAPVARPWRVAFEYVPEGVLCKGVWYPVLKMEWVEARGLIPFVENHLWHPTVLTELADSFARMVGDLAALGVAHGDLQHGNLLVTPAGELKLIDYDGMYVPGLESLGASELGHANYQSPARTLGTWGPHLDRFSAWLIYASLVAVATNPALWTLLHAEGDEALLFHKTDFASPASSPAVGALERSSEPALRALAAAIRPLWAHDLAKVPPLDASAAPPPARRAAVTPGPPLGAAKRSGGAAPADADAVVGALAEWQASLAALGEPLPETDTGEHPSWLIGHLPALAAQPFAPRDPFVRVLAAAWVAVVVAVVLLGVAGVAAVPVAAAGLVATAAVLGAGALGLRRTPEWRAKRERRGACRRAHADTSTAARALARAERERHAAARAERNALEVLARRAAEARTGEDEELGAIDRRSTVQRSELDWQRQAVQANETWELGNTLRLLQEEHVMERLHGAQLRWAPGIGPMVAGRLALHGITTAADFTGVSIGSSGHGPDIWIERRRGVPVRVNSIGEAKAEALEAWRRSVDARARASAPQSLPADRALAIRSKHAPERQSLASQEQAAKAESVQAQHWARERWLSRHGEIAAEVAERRRALRDQRGAAELELAAARRRAGDAGWREKLADRELAAYRRVSLGRYVVSALRG